MAYSMYEISPNTKSFSWQISIQYDQNWSPVLIQNNQPWVWRSEYQI
jgi:hypothetical protein